MTPRDDSDPLVREQERAAAAAAGRIGGRAGDEDLDPAERPVREAGGGEAEGFEQAEQDLIDHAEHTTGEGIPRLDQMGEEPELDRAVYGEPDEEDVTEKTADPREGADDPGGGPGIAAER
jgi:hypothetical protein